MKTIVVIVLFLSFVSGCGVSRHSGLIETFGPEGNSMGCYVVTLDRPMSMEVTDPNGVMVKADSRGDSSWGQFIKGMIEIITLGLVVND